MRAQTWPSGFGFVKYTIAILFDLDGTLIDSAPDLHAAANRLLVQENRDPLSLATIRQFIGNGVPKLVERIIDATGLARADHARLTAAFLADYTAHATDLTRTYEGVTAALSAVQAQGIALGIVTNKPEKPARQILSGLNLAPFFELVIGGDTFPSRKPDPTGLQTAFDRLGAHTRIYVGDSEVDAETAQRADIPFLLFTEGYRKSEIEKIPHQQRFDHFASLPTLVAPYLSEQRLV